MTVTKFKAREIKVGAHSHTVVGLSLFRIDIQTKPEIIVGENGAKMAGHVGQKLVEMAFGGRVMEGLES